MHAFAPPAGAVAVLVAGGVIWRTRAPERPLTARRILMPPLGMSTGLGMFLAPAMRVPWSWALAAVAAGALLLAYPLRRFSRLVRRGDAILLPRTLALPAVLVVLAAVRLALRGYLDSVLPPERTAGVFYLLALGMIGTWRLSMYRDYRALRDQPDPAAGSAASACPA